MLDPTLDLILDSSPWVAIAYLVTKLILGLAPHAERVILGLWSNRPIAIELDKFTAGCSDDRLVDVQRLELAAVVGMGDGPLAGDLEQQLASEVYTAEDGSGVPGRLAGSVAVVAGHHRHQRARGARARGPADDGAGDHAHVLVDRVHRGRGDDGGAGQGGVAETGADDEGVRRVVVGDPDQGLELENLAGLEPGGGDGVRAEDGLVGGVGEGGARGDEYGDDGEHEASSSTVPTRAISSERDLCSRRPEGSCQGGCVRVVVWTQVVSDPNKELTRATTSSGLDQTLIEQLLPRN